MIKKLLVFLESGGIKEVIIYASGYIRKYFYYKSETIFFYLNKEDFVPSNKVIDVIFKNVDDAITLESINFDRVKMLEYRKWLNEGSKVIIGFSASQPVSYHWLHFNFFNIHGLCNIILKENQCWVGPGFVNKSFRGTGINSKQISIQIRNTPESITQFLSSTNANNIPSIKLLTNLGFKIGLKMVKYYGIFSDRGTSIHYENEGKTIFQFK